MKKIVYILISLFILTGCDDISNTPTKQVEGFFNKYQKLDNEVLSDLDQVIVREEEFDQGDREKYREIIKDQYKNLSYKIKEEKIDGDIATVTVEITVKDFAKILAEAEDYKNNHLDEFKDKNGAYQESLFKKHVINKLESAKEKVKYTLDLRLSKIDKKWKLDGIDSDTEEKILGIYQY